MSRPLRVLIVEDSEDDTILLMRALTKGGYAPEHQRVDTEGAMSAALDHQSWDIVIADYAMPRFDALSALRLTKERDPDLPFIIVSGRIGEAVAVAAMRAGAQDYIMKSNLARLCPAIERELKDAAVRRERRLAGEALQQAQKMESLGLMAGGVAHDFNNLLVAIMGQCAIALKKLPEESKAAGHLHKVLHAAEKAADLTRQMLAYAGGGEVDLQSIDLSQLMSDSAALLDAVLPGHVSLELELTRPVPHIVADPNQIQQILLNLALNGAEAIGNKAGTLILRTGLQEEPPVPERAWIQALEIDWTQHHVFLEVQDSGSGMTRENAVRIFDPFFTTKGTGRGLGLAAVLGIVRGHRGGLLVKSRPGRGTTFRVLFPPDRARLPESDNEPGETESAPKTVLVIDDEQMVLDAVTEILSLQGIEVIPAGSGEEGLRLFGERKTAVDLVLLDLTMPEMSGEETLLRMRQIDPGARVLITSGFGPAEAKSRLKGNQTLGFLQKPFGSTTLVDAVDRALHSTND